jgi:exonuclease III
MDNTILLSWNVRGLNDRARRDVVRTLVDDIHPSIARLQETKLSVINQHLVFALFGSNFCDFAYLPASNTRGGILVAAKQSDVAISDVLIGCYSVTVKVTPRVMATGEDQSWWLSSVYGPQDDDDKILFLEELEAIRDACPGPWAICGDFNLILSEADKNNQRIHRANLLNDRSCFGGAASEDSGTGMPKKVQTRFSPSSAGWCGRKGMLVVSGRLQPRCRSSSASSGRKRSSGSGREQAD